MSETKVIDGKKFASALSAKIKSETRKLYNKHKIVPGLAVVLVGEDPASQVYVRRKGEQTKELDFCSGFQVGHPKSFELSEEIVKLMPKGLDKVFFTGSGSESADTSLKMARAYWRKKGLASKTRLIGRVKGYHGVNFGGISVGGIVGNLSLIHI